MSYINSTLLNQTVIHGLMFQTDHYKMIFERHSTNDTTRWTPFSDDYVRKQSIKPTHRLSKRIPSFSSIAIADRYNKLLEILLITKWWNSSYMCLMTNQVLNNLTVARHWSLGWRPNVSATIVFWLWCTIHIDFLTRYSWTVVQNNFVWKF